jgi:uncharacterized protein (DUF2141 family)
MSLLSRLVKRRARPVVWLGALVCCLAARATSADPSTTAAPSGAKPRAAPRAQPPAATAAQAAPAGQTAVLYVRLMKLHSNKGQVGCLLFDSKRGFPDEGKIARQGRWCPVSNAQSLCTFDPIPAGVYAVACFHDEDKDREMDTGFMGIPTEGYVTSNEAKAYMGPPRFEDAKFKFSGSPTELRLRMSY